MNSDKAVKRLSQIASQIDSKSKPMLQTQITQLLTNGKTEEASQTALSAFLQPPRYQPNAQQLAVLQRAEKASITVNDTKIQTYTWNSQARSGVILSHGFSTSAAFLAPMVQHLLATCDHRLVAVDHAAHGASSGTEASVGHLIVTLKKLVEDEQAAGKHVISLIGHSVGATALVMLLSRSPKLFDQQASRPSLIAINPPLQAVTLMRGFCVQHALPLSLINGMLAALEPAPEHVLKLGMVQAWAKDLRVLLFQDRDDKVSNPEDTEKLATQLRSYGAILSFEKTEKLGHFKPAGTAHVLDLVQSFIQ